MSLAHRAARGVLWMMVTSVGGRAIGVAGTLVMTRFLSPDTIGEVSDATILCMTASWFTIWGYGQYAIVKGRGPDAAEVTWHTTLAYIVPGAFSLGLVALFGGYLTPFLDAPHAAVYIPGMALAIFIRRIGAIPERVLARELEFRAIGITLTVGEASYTFAAVGLAVLGFGGMAVVLANILQSCVVVGILIHATGLRSWLTPTRLRWSRIRDMLRFGIPIGLGSTAHSASRYWDNLTVSHFFGPGPTGVYNMAYNLADIPALQIGDQVASVILPSMSELPPERRAAALERSSALLSLIIFPLAVGLGLIAYPLISLILPSNKWQEVAPLLALLTCLSVFRPMSWVIGAYMVAQEKTRLTMILELVKLAVLLGGLALLAPYGLRVASVAVGASFGIAALGGVAIVVREGVSIRRLAIGFIQPLIACAAMGAAVWAIDVGLRMAGASHPVVYVVAEVLGGAAAYVAAALVIARSTSRDLLDLLRRSLRRKADA